MPSYIFTLKENSFLIVLNLSQFIHVEKYDKLIIIACALCSIWKLTQHIVTFAQ